MNRLIIGVLSLFLFTACGAGKVTKQDVVKQEEEALEKMEDAKIAAKELAEMKQQFSEDYKKAKIKSLKNQMDDLDDDIDKLSDVSSAQAKTGTEGLVSNLKKERKQLKNQMDKVETMERENWQETMDSIDNQIESLKRMIKSITANLEDREAVE